MNGNGGNGLLTGTASWAQLTSKGTIFAWFAGLAFVLIAAFLWTQVLREID